jgi:hypothetical protein
MKLKLDENIPGSAKSRLVALGYDTDTVLDEGLGGRQVFQEDSPLRSAKISPARVTQFPSPKPVHGRGGAMAFREVTMIEIREVEPGGPPQARRAAGAGGVRFRRTCPCRGGRQGTGALVDGVGAQFGTRCRWS